MINKLYDFRQVQIPAALLQAVVTQEEMAGELQLLAARFTTIAPTDLPIQAGDVVTLTFEDAKTPEGIRKIYANVGRAFDDIETLLPGHQVGDNLEIPYAGKQVRACIQSVKRLTIPALTDDYVRQLGIDGVTTLAQCEDYVFAQLAQRQRKRKFQGIMGIVSKAINEHTEFAPLEEDHPWFQALHGLMMDRVEALAAQEGKTADEVLPMAVRMPDKPLEECRQALKNMCVERARQGALGQAYAKENGVELPQAEAIPDLIGNYVDYLNQVVFDYFAPQIQVDHP